MKTKKILRDKYSLVVEENSKLIGLILATLDNLKMETTRFPHYKNLKEGLDKIINSSEHSVSENE